VYINTINRLITCPQFIPKVYNGHGFWQLKPEKKKNFLTKWYYFIQVKLPAKPGLQIQLPVHGWHLHYKVKLWSTKIELIHPIRTSSYMSVLFLSHEQEREHTGPKSVGSSHNLSSQNWPFQPSWHEQLPSIELQIPPLVHWQSFLHARPYFPYGHSSWHLKHQLLGRNV